METELQTLVARLSTHRVLPRTDAQVRRALTDDLFYNALNERLAACGLELVEHPYADNVCLRVRRDMEHAVFGGEDAWLSNNIGLKRDQIALLVVLWALLILPKRSRQHERRDAPNTQRQNEMFAVEKPLPTAADIGISVAEATLVADFGDRLGGRTRISIALPMLSRLGFIERRNGRISEGPLLDLALDYSRMAPRVLDGTLSELFGNLAEQAEAPNDPSIDSPAEEDQTLNEEQAPENEDDVQLP